MASFLDTLIKVVLLSTQLYATFTLGELIQKMKVDTATNERDFTKNYGKQTDWMIETGHPAEWISNRLENFIPAFRKVQRNKKFWNGVGGIVLFSIFILLQLLACLGYFNVDFVPGLR